MSTFGTESLGASGLPALGLTFTWAGDVSAVRRDSSWARPRTRSVRLGGVPRTDAVKPRGAAGHGSAVRRTLVVGLGVSA